MNPARLILVIILITFSISFLVSCEINDTDQDRTQFLTESPFNQGNVITPTSVRLSTMEIPLITRTPLATLSPIFREQEIEKLYFHNGGCKLPCFWGIVPGRTSLTELVDRLSFLGSVQDDTRLHDSFNTLLVNIEAPSGVDTFHEKEWVFRIVARNDTVEGITVSTTYLEQTSVQSISSMLSTFGKPKEIWIAVLPYIPEVDFDTDYEIALFYPSKGIRIRGSGIATIVNETDGALTVSICPQNIAETIDMDRHYPFSMQLWSPENNLSFEDLMDTQLFGHEFYALLDDLDSTMSSEKFVETYMDPITNQCFEITY